MRAARTVQPAAYSPRRPRQPVLRKALRSHIAKSETFSSWPRAFMTTRSLPWISQVIARMTSRMRWLVANTAANLVTQRHLFLAASLRIISCCPESALQIGATLHAYRQLQIYLLTWEN